VPVVVSPPPAARAAIEESLDLLAELGVEIESFGGGALVIKALPAVVPPGQAERFLAEVSEGLADEEARQRIRDPRDRVLATVACKAAIKINFPLTVEKMDWVVRELFRSSDPYRCPHGRQIVLRIDHDTIERNFGRRGWR